MCNGTMNDFVLIFGRETITRISVLADRTTCMRQLRGKQAPSAFFTWRIAGWLRGHWSAAM